jgi:hypothetical protein
VLIDAATNHVIYIDQLGRAIDMGPAPNDWPSSAGVAVSRQGKNAMTGAMMAQVGQHQATMAGNAGQYGEAEAKNTGKLGGEEAEDMGKIGTLIGAVLSPLQAMGNVASGGLNAWGGVAGGALQAATAPIGAMGAAGMAGGGHNDPKPLVTAQGDTPESAAPAAGTEDQRDQRGDQDGTHAERH